MFYTCPDYLYFLYTPAIMISVHLSAHAYQMSFLCKPIVATTVG